MHSISWTENDSAHSKAALCLSLIPPRVNLIDREEDIQSIKELLSQNSIVCLLGEAGIGKTAIATHLANNEKDSIITKDSNYNHVAWVDGRKDIEIGFHHLDIPDSFSQSSEKDRYHSIIKWLQQNPTFIVIDDLDHTLDEKEAV